MYFITVDIHFITVSDIRIFLQRIYGRLMPCLHVCVKQFNLFDVVQQFWSNFRQHASDRFS